jgi:hypothetical protein
MNIPRPYQRRFRSNAPSSEQQLGICKGLERGVSHRCHSCYGVVSTPRSFGLPLRLCSQIPHRNSYSRFSYANPPAIVTETVHTFASILSCRTSYLTYPLTASEFSLNPFCPFASSISHALLPFNSYSNRSSILRTWVVVNKIPSLTTTPTPFRHVRPNPN